MPGTLRIAASRTAATVPELYTSVPRLAPALMPERLQRFRSAGQEPLTRWPRWCTIWQARRQASRPVNVTTSVGAGRRIDPPLFEGRISPAAVPGLPGTNRHMRRVLSSLLDARNEPWTNHFHP